MLKIAIAGVLSAALIILTPHTQAAPPNINNAVRNTNVHAVQVEAPRKEPTAELVSQEKTPTDPQPISQTVESNNGCSQYRYLVEQYDWNVQIMLAVMQAESGCNPNAVNPVNYDGVGDYGLMQLHGQNISDPAQNVAAAYRLWKVQGYQAWSAYNNQSYWKFM